MRRSRRSHPVRRHDATRPPARRIRAQRAAPRGGDDDSDPEPDGHAFAAGRAAGGRGARREQEKAERERNAAERARAMSERLPQAMDEQDRGEGPSDDGDKTDGGDDRTGGEGGDLTNYVDDAEIEAMLGETEAANNWSKVTDREYAWVKAVGKTCQAIMVEKTLGLIERYAPLRAYVRYWAAVVRADETLSNHADAAEQAKAVAANTLGRILTSAAEGMPNVGFVGAAELAALHRRRDPSISAGWLKALIYGDSTMSFTGGTILSLGGPAAAPVTAPPALAMYFTIRLRLCLAIAALGGCDVLGPEAGAAALACFFGTDARELLDARPRVEELDALIAAADDAAANCADATDGLGQSSSWLPDVSGAMSRVFEAGASAQRVAQRCAAGYAARASAHVARRAAMGRETFQSGTGDVDADRARVYDAAYRRALPRGAGAGDGGARVPGGRTWSSSPPSWSRSCPATSPFEPRTRPSSATCRTSRPRRRLSWRTPRTPRTRTRRPRLRAGDGRRTSPTAPRGGKLGGRGGERGGGADERRRRRRGRGHSVAVEQGERDSGEFDQGDGSGEGGRDGARAAAFGSRRAEDVRVHRVGRRRLTLSAR